MSSDTESPLVRYNRPVVLSKSAGTEKTSSKSDMKQLKSAAQGRKDADKTTRMDVKAGAQLLTPREREIRDILNIILPPRCWSSGGQMWKQTVSSMPATCEDVNNLQEKFDKRLHMAQARETGLCNIRRAIYAECFNELIRQETIYCAERGMLLVRIRDEMEVTLDAYEALYCSAIGFGIRKALQSHIEKDVLSQQVEGMEVARDTIEEMLQDMKQKFEMEQSKDAELFTIEVQRFNEEMAFCKKASALLKTQLDGVMGPKK